MGKVLLYTGFFSIALFIVTMIYSFIRSKVKAEDRDEQIELALEDKQDGITRKFVKQIRKQ